MQDIGLDWRREDWGYLQQRLRCLSVLGDDGERAGLLLLDLRTPMLFSSKACRKAPTTIFA